MDDLGDEAPTQQLGAHFLEARQRTAWIFLAYPDFLALGGHQHHAAASHSNLGQRRDRRRIRSRVGRGDSEHLTKPEAALLGRVDELLASKPGNQRQVARVLALDLLERPTFA